MRIYCITKLRGFQRHLLDYFKENNEVIEKKSFYEVSSSIKKSLSRIIRSKLSDYLGIIMIVKDNTLNNVKDNTLNNVIVFSYNRFVKSQKPYIINLENPTALYHYSLARRKTYFGKIKIKKALNKSNLKKIVCISKACYDTFDVLTNNSLKSKSKLIQIYPLIPDSKLHKKDVEKLARKTEIKCLFISSEFYLKSGKEVIDAFEILNNTGYDSISIDIITKIDTIRRTDLVKIKSLSNIRLHEFNLKYKELTQFYNNASVMIHLSRQESFGLVVLEALKFGCCLIGTKIYALSEMIENNHNGFLVEPKYKFFNDDNLPNQYVWNNRKQTIYSNYEDRVLINFIIEKLIYINSNRSELYRLCLNSLTKSRNMEFGEKAIKEKWHNVLNTILK